MDGVTRPSTAVFERSFYLPGLGRAMPAGEYDVLATPPVMLAGLQSVTRDDGCPGIVLIDLGSGGTPTAEHDWFRVTLAALDAALATDRLPPEGRAAAMLETVLGNAMVRLAMREDPGLEGRFRQLNARMLGHRPLTRTPRGAHGKPAV